MGTANTDKVARQRLRDRLRAKGVPEAEVQRLVAAKRDEQAAARGDTRPGGPKRPKPARPDLDAEYQRWYDAHRRVDPTRPQRIEDETYRRLSLKDSAHRPRAHDPLTTGQARVTGETARAVKRGTTITLHEHREREA